MNERYEQIPVDRIRTGRNIRRRFDDNSMAELIESVKKVGVLQPVLVVPDKNEPGSYILVAGERRVRAARAAGLNEVPAVVKELGEDEIKEVMLIENLQRQDLDPIEEAEGLRELLATGRYTQERLAERLGVSQSHIANRLRLLRLPESVRDIISRKIISPTHGLALVRLCPKKQEPSPLLEEALNRIMGVSAREAEDALDRFLSFSANSLEPADDGERKNVIEYGWMAHHALFDPSECNKCSYRVTARTISNVEMPVCVRPDCWEKKQKSAFGKLRQLKSEAKREQSESCSEKREEKRKEKVRELVEQVGKRLERTLAAAEPASWGALDYDIKEATRLQGLALSYWREAENPWTEKPEVIFDLEFYLELAALLEHFEVRKNLGATRIPEQFGAGDLFIPAQGIEMANLYGVTEAQVMLEPLRFNWGRGRVYDSEPAGRVYYRVALYDTGTSKSMRQVAVIPCRTRDIVLSCNDTVMMRRELIPKWAELLSELPAFPDVAKEEGRAAS